MVSRVYEQGWSEIATRNHGHASMWSRLRAGGYRMFSDEALLRRARLRDTAAFDAFVARYRDRLFTMAVISLGNEADADDALCDTLISAYEDIHSPTAAAAPATWLYEHGFRAVFSRMGLPAGGYAIPEDGRSALRP